MKKKVNFVIAILLAAALVFSLFMAFRIEPPRAYTAVCYNGGQVIYTGQVKYYWGTYKEAETGQIVFLPEGSCVFERTEE